MSVCNRKIGGSGHQGRNIFPIPDGFLILGYYQDGSDRDALLIKVDQNGAPIWAKAIGKPGSNEKSIEAELQGSSLWISGWSNTLTDDIFLLKLDEYGEIEPPNCVWIEEKEINGVINTNPFQ
ncbi:MAG: hypothetical protein AAFU60_05855, partial [Bacteroidota bacterium]